LLLFPFMSGICCLLLLASFAVPLYATNHWQPPSGDAALRVGRIVAGLLGAAWTVVSFLVVPMLVVENKSPFAALQESAGLVKKTWGEQVAGNFGFGLMFFLLAIPALVVMVLSIVSGNFALMIGCIGLGVVYLVILGLVQSALQPIYQAAVFLYARDGQMPEGFEAELPGNAMVRKKRPNLESFPTRSGSSSYRGAVKW
jgi:Family of unknown function (DUF6159)